MSEPKTRSTDVPVADFLAQLTDPGRHADCLAIANLMASATGEPAQMWGSSIVGFGRYRYRYESGREGEWPVVGFAPRKNDLTLYLTAGFDGHVALLARLGKHKTAKACLYIKKLADVDLAVLSELIDASVAAMEARRMRC